MKDGSPDTGLPESDEERALAAEYALGLLSDDERSAFERQLDRSATLRGEVAQWDMYLADLVLDEVEEVAPPPQVQRRVEASALKSDKTSIWQQVWPYALGGAAAALMLWLAMTFGVLIP